jgi:long-chain acyl-CoA synthetase
MANFVARIVEAAERVPEQPAIELIREHGLETTSYADLLGESRQIAGWLREAGFASGDRAAILADNDARWIAAYLGVLHRGGVAVPLDTAYKAGQVATVLDHSGATFLFTSARHLDTARAGVEASGTPATPAARLVVIDGEAAGLPGRAAFDAAAAADTVTPRAPDDAAVMLYTSGTTSDPKGVVLTHHNLESERAAALAIVPVSDADAVLGVLPLFHALAQMANLLLPLTTGARVVFLETVSSSSLLAALASRPITIFACVPQFFYLIHQRVQAEVARGGIAARAAFRVLVGTNAWLRDHLHINPGRLVFARVHRVLGSSMRILITGGSRFDPAIGRDLYGLGFTVLNAYGLTETSGGATVVRPGDRFTSSVGQPFPGVEIRIGPPESTDDDAGEVLIRGPIVMREYFRRPDATAEALVDGWLQTGDLGRLDADGRLYITGRKKEIIVLSSGKNLYPEEIEAHYRQAPIVKELCVLGLSRPGEPAAERLHAVIVPDEAVMRERGQVNVRERVRFELETHAVHLPAHKRILSYDIWLEPLPRTSTGKIRRHEVERRLREHTVVADAGDARPLTDVERQWLQDARRAEAFEALRGRLAQPGLPPDANLELDLGLDSMERVEVLTWLEQRAGTRVPAEVRATIFTARQLIDAVLAAPQADGESAGGAGGEDAGADDPWDHLLTQPADPALVQQLSQSKFIRAALLFVMLRAMALIAWLVLGFRVARRDRWPAEGPCLVCPNHQSYADGAFVAAALPFRLFRRVFFVGAAEYFQTPLTAWLARAVNIVPVDPDANLVTAMQAGAAGLGLGKVLILFPEGERSIDGGVKPFRKGAAILAAHLNVAMVPVALDGPFGWWPRGRGLLWGQLFRGRARVRIAIGSPIAAGPDYAASTAALESAVRGLLSGHRSGGRDACDSK